MSHHRRQAINKKHFVVLLIVIAGLAVELASSYAIKPSKPYGINDYTMFWLSATHLRNVLFIFSALMLYSVKGSIPIFILMGFNLFAIGMNVMYILEPSSYATINPYRKEFFGPAYRAAELIITTQALWHVRNKIYISVSLFLRSCRSVDNIRRLFNNGAQE